MLLKLLIIILNIVRNLINKFHYIAIGFYSIRNITYKNYK